MRRRAPLPAALALAIGLALAAGPMVASAAGGGPNPLANLRVSGGAASWHAANDFILEWDPIPASESTVTSIDYLLRDPSGKPLGEVVRLPADRYQIASLYIPPPAGQPRTPPGQYSVEFWSAGPAGDSPPVSATLRLDDTRPGAARPLGPSGWIRAGTETTLKIEHPAAPLPISGLRGYAIVVDHGSETSPCVGPNLCSESETDLSGGIDDDSISLGVLPKGTNVARVVAVSGSGMRSETLESLPLRVDGTEPTVILTGAREGWSAGPVRVTATATDSQSGMAPAGPAGPFTAIAVDGGVPTVTAGDSATATVVGDGVHSVSAYGRDAAGNVAEDGTAFDPPPAYLVRIDESPPQVAFARVQDPAEPELIEAGVADPLSGPDPARGSIALRPVGSTARFEPIPTSVSTGLLSAHWDSDAFPPGSYEFIATGYDAAGNSASSGRRANGTRMVLSNPLKLQTEVQFGFGGKQLIWHRCRHERDRIHCRREVIGPIAQRPAVRSTAYGRGTPVAGRLRSASGTPLAGQPVEVTETFAGGATASRRTTLIQTGSDGAFLAHLSPGPSREIQVAFAGSGLLSRTASRVVQLEVETAIRLHASASNAAIGGAPVVFRGQIAHREAAIPAEGRPVQLQFRVGDSAWSEFRTVQTDAQGRFRYPYSFSDDDSRGVRFQFRAYAPPQPGWPYAPATSPAVFVTGR